jgi:hypothetical protein
MEIKSIAHLTTEIADSFDFVKDDIQMRFEDSGVKDASEARMLINCLDKLEALKEALSKIENCYDVIREEINFVETELVSETNDLGLRRIEVEVSRGMREQSLLSLTAAKKRGIVDVDEELEIVVPDGTSFKTKIVSPGNRLRERGRIKAFYEAEDVSADDVIILEEIEPKKWKLYVSESSRASHVEAIAALEKAGII